MINEYLYNINVWGYLGRGVSKNQFTPFPLGLYVDDRRGVEWSRLTWLDMTCFLSRNPCELCLMTFRPEGFNLYRFYINYSTETKLQSRKRQQLNLKYPEMVICIKSLDSNLFHQYEISFRNYRVSRKKGSHRFKVPEPCPIFFLRPTT